MILFLDNLLNTFIGINSCLIIFSINKLNIRSSGGILKIGDVEEVMGSSSFTKYEIQDLAHLLDMDMKMGEMQIRNVQKPFSKIHLNSGRFYKLAMILNQIIITPNF